MMYLDCIMLKQKAQYLVVDSIKWDGHDGLSCGVNLTHHDLRRQQAHALAALVGSAAHRHYP